MNLLAPGALWALLALVVPLALHLRRRRVGRTIPVGSIRHLESLPTAERRGLRLREKRLLLLRALIVAILAVLLARPVLPQFADPARSFIVVDSATPSPLIDSLGGVGSVSVERLDDPWRRVSELDDSLPAGMPLIIAASGAGALYAGPRPVVRREVTWRPIVSTPTSTRTTAGGSVDTGAVTPLQRRALASAVAAAAEEFGPLTDSAGWRTRLPAWWRDSIQVVAFPIAVAQALAPGKALPTPSLVSAGQLRPREVSRPGRGTDALDLHWWFWGAALLLFLLERVVASRWREAT